MRRALIGATFLVALGMVAVAGFTRVSVDAQAPDRGRDDDEQIPAFYDPPVPLPPGEPGELIRVEPAPDTPSGVSAWRILYHSRTLDDRDIAVSGLVVVPDRPAPPGGFPVLTLAHGTTGTARSCAPSLMPFSSGRAMQPSWFSQTIKPFTDAGYAVTATDYYGLGTPGVNPYLVGVDAARNVLDAVRAIHHLPDLSLSDQTLIWGHSEGGQSSTFAGQIAPDYAPELNILGVVAGAPAAELPLMTIEVVRLTTRSPLTGLMAMIARGWSATYPDVQAETVLTPLGLSGLPLVARECSDPVLAYYAIHPAPAYIKAEGLTTPPWPELIETNTPGAVETPAPIYIYQGGADPIIKPEFTFAFVSRLCGVGDTVSFRLYPGEGHISVIAPSMPDTIAWMNDRLAGMPAPTDCSGK